MKELSLVLKFIPFGFSALLPVISPIGSALLFCFVLAAIIWNGIQTLMRTMPKH